MGGTGGWKGKINEVWLKKGTTISNSAPMARGERGGHGEEPKLLILGKDLHISIP